MAKTIRSNYIKSLMEDKEELNKTLRESTKDTLKTIVDEAVNKNLRSMISEADEDEYDEEEVNKDSNVLDGDTKKNTDDEKGTDENPTDGKDGAEEGDGLEPAPDASDFGGGDESGDENTESDDEVWDSLEQYKDVDGEYDLTGMGNEEVVKVLRVMKPEDGIRVVKNGEDSITLTDDNTDTEYIIQLEAEPEDDDETYEYELDVDESFLRVDEYDSHVGYTDSYQKETAMTTPPNTEPANPKSTYSMDAGVPKGTEKPWAGDGDDSPFNQKVKGEGVNEGCDDGSCENEPIEEGATSVAEMGPNARGASKAHMPTNSKPIEAAREGSEGGQLVKPTTEAPYTGVHESIKKRANQIFRENKELKEIAGQIKERLSEACIINASLGKIIKLVTENTTTRDEKLDIVNRFNDVKSIKEANTLYETISRELQNAHPINNVEHVMNGQLAESKKSVVETSMYQSEDLAKTVDLMKRLDNIK